jgi:bifunctional DNA-binding transcriptional regulator/antitoxin component of YhaV-PrlF toxin-antitoxin module
MASDTIAGFTHMDDKGRISLAKPVRQALGLEAGSSLAWLKIGNAVLFVPQDQHLRQLMDAASHVLESANIAVRQMLDDLPAARAEVVAEHYGEEVIRALELIRDNRIVDA